MAKRLRAYVTGATGSLGFNIVQVLRSSEEWDITILHRTSSDCSMYDEYPEIARREVDLSDETSIRDAIPRSTDAVFHAAGNVSYWPDPNQWRDNVLITRNLAAVALEQGVRRFIYTSTGATLPYHGRRDTRLIARIQSGYVRTKREAEIEIEDAIARGLDCVIMQPIVVIGPYDFHRHYSRLFLEEHPYALPGYLEFCDAEDVARAHVSAFHHGERGEHYVLGGTYLSWLEFLSIVAAVTGVKPPEKVASGWILNVRAWCELIAYHFSGRTPGLTPELVSLLKGGERVSIIDRLRSERDLGYQSRDIRESCEACYRWLTAPK